jgi:hypothetical protein
MVEKPDDVSNILRAILSGIVKLLASTMAARIVGYDLESCLIQCPWRGGTFRKLAPPRNVP